MPRVCNISGTLMALVLALAVPILLGRNLACKRHRTKYCSTARSHYHVNIAALFCASKLMLQKTATEALLLQPPSIPPRCTVGIFAHFSQLHRMCVISWQVPPRQGPHLSIRIGIWILPSDTETSAATP